MNGIPLSELNAWLSETDQLQGEMRVLGTPVADSVSGACVDSRLATQGSLFVALPGESTDGHRFVDDAVGRGAVAALVNANQFDEVRGSVFGSVVLIPVLNTLDSIQEIAARWRKQHPDLVRIAVTGSNGKTTTKEILVSIFSRAGSTVFSHGNYNSDIGLPLELLRIRPVHQYGIFELGMNRPGEIAELARLVEPDIALITNVGSAHVGMVGSRRQIAEEKKAVFGTFTGSQVAVVPADGKFSGFLASDVNGTVVRHGPESAGLVGMEDADIAGTTLIFEEGRIRLGLPGTHMVANAIAAITVARKLGIDFEIIRAGVESVRPVFGRAQVLSGRVTVIQDSYNANPESMATAIDLLHTVPTTGQRIAILGSMKELGKATRAAHRDVLDLALSANLDQVWLVGEEFGALELEPSPRIRSFSIDQWDILEQAASQISDGDAVLIKGSRALELERLVPVFSGRLVHG